MGRVRKPELAYLDTHVVMWLHDGLTERLSPAAIQALESNPLLVSPIVELELQFLHEIGRIRPTGEQVISILSDDIGLRRGAIAFVQIARLACGLSWTRDPFDRLIVAEALAANGKLVTKDRLIIEHFDKAVW